MSNVLAFVFDIKQMEIIFIGIFGLIIGSFLAALTYRMPRGISTMQGRSFCPNCKHTISWFDNIPLLSYLLLGGRCRNCKKPISSRYFLIESSTALLFILFGLYLVPLWYFPLGVILISIFVIDSEHQIIPDELIFAGVILMLGLFLVTDYEPLYANILAGCISSVFLLLIHFGTARRGMGLGDVKFALLGGMIVGPALSIVWIFLSFIIGGLVGIILLIGGSAKIKDKIAFGPFLVVGLLLTMLFGKIIYGFIFGV